MSGQIIRHQQHLTHLIRSCCVGEKCRRPHSMGCHVPERWNNMPKSNPTICPVNHCFYSYSGSLSPGPAGPAGLSPGLHITCCIVYCLICPSLIAPLTPLIRTALSGSHMICALSDPQTLPFPWATQVFSHSRRTAVPLEVLSIPSACVLLAPLFSSLSPLAPLLPPHLTL